MAKAENITINVNVNWEPINPTALFLVAEEIKAAREEYDEAHDDLHGPEHLVSQALRHLDRLEKPSLSLSPAGRQHEITVAIGLLFNAYDTIQRLSDGVHDPAPLF